MNNKAFIAIYTNKGFKLFVEQQARRYSKRRELQEEYEQEAWLAIGHAPEDGTLGTYLMLAAKAMYSAYWQNYKETLTRRAIHNDKDLKNTVYNIFGEMEVMEKPTV